MVFKKKEPELPKTQKELMDLVRETKKKLGIDKSPDLNNSLNELRGMLESIRKLGPEKISDKIDAYLSKEKKKLN